MTCEKFHRADGGVQSWIEYEYDAAGNMTKKTSLKDDGTVFQTVEKSYNSDNDVVVETRYNSEGEIIEMFQYVYYF